MHKIGRTVATAIGIGLVPATSAGSAPLERRPVSAAVSVETIPVGRNAGLLRLAPGRRRLAGHLRHSTL